MGSRNGMLACLAALGCLAGCPRGPAAGSEDGPSPAPAPENGPAAAAAGPAWRPGYTRPPVVDYHTHVMPSGLERMARIMGDNGLAAAVNLSGGSPGQGAEVSVAMSGYLPDLVPFYNPNWKRRGLPGFGALEAADLERTVKEMGFGGLKISKALGLYLDDAEGRRIPVDWPELDPLWAKAGELGVPVSIHTGDPKAFWLPVTPENERYDELALHPSWSYHGGDFPTREQLLAERDRVIARHPGTTFVCVHFGGNPEDLAYVDALMKRFPNVMVDTAARLGEIGRHPPEKVRDFFIRYKDRVLFGTDLGVGGQGLMLGSSGAEPPTMDDVKPFYDAHWRFFEGKERGIPHPTPIQGRWTIDAIDLPDDVLRALYADNARRLLRLDQRKAAPPPSGDDHRPDPGVRQ